MNKLLKNIHPSAGEIAMFSSNLANKDKQVVIVIDGISYTMSPRLTADFRNKKVSADELGEYVVRTIELTDDAGVVTGTMNSLGYAGEDTVVAVNWKASAKVAVKRVSVAELEVLVAY